MGNTLCKPVPEQFIEQQPKNVEPLLTEEAIKILNVENEKKNEELEKEETRVKSPKTTKRRKKK